MGQKTNQKQTLQKLNTIQKKQTTQNTAKQNNRKWGGLIIQCSWAHMGLRDFVGKPYIAFTALLSLANSCMQ